MRTPRLPRNLETVARRQAGEQEIAARGGELIWEETCRRRPSKWVNLALEGPKELAHR